MSTNESNVKIVRETIDESSIEVLEISRAEYVGEYKIHLGFSDGKNHIIDFGPFLKNARNPSAIKYRDLDKFRQFSLEHRNLHWNDYELCFLTEDLYNNDIGVEMEEDDRKNLAEMTREFEVRV